MSCIKEHVWEKKAIVREVYNSETCVSIEHPIRFCNQKWSKRFDVGKK